MEPQASYGLRHRSIFWSPNPERAARSASSATATGLHRPCVHSAGELSCPGAFLGLSRHFPTVCCNADDLSG
jgi:hypothetical protein